MKRRWVVALMLVLAVMAAACGDSSDDEGGDASSDTTEAPKTPPTFAADSVMAAIQKRGKLVVGTKFDQPLFGLKNPTTGAVDGFDVEIANLIAKGIFGDDIKDKVEFKEAVSKNREAFIQDGTVDIVIATYTINDERKKVVDFAGPYFLAHQDILIKKSDTAIKGVDDLNGKKVCSAQGSTSLKNLQAKAPKADVSTLFDKYSLCVEALNDGRVQAVTTDNAILAAFVAAEPDKYKLAGDEFSDEPYGIGLKKGDTVWRTFLNDRLEKVFDDGSWDKAFEKTLGTVIKPTPEPPKVDRY